MDHNLSYQQQGPSFQQEAQAFQQVFQPITATFPIASNDPHYKGYDAAVIEHAKLLQVQQQKEKLFGASGRKSVGKWKKKGPPKEPVDPRKYFCEICVVTCAGDESYQAHLQGKSHKHKEALKASQNKLDTTRPGYHCEVCNTTCSAKDIFHAHLNGAKHNRAIKTLQMLGKPVPEYLLNYNSQGDPMQNLPVQKKVVGVSATKFVGGVKLSTTHEEEEGHTVNGNDQDSGFASIGEEFIEVVPVPPTPGRKSRLPSFYCRICDCAIGDPTARDLHLRGRRHRLAYKKKIDSSIPVDGKQLARGGSNGGLTPKPVPKTPETNRSNYCPLPINTFSHASFPDTTFSDFYDEQFASIRLEKIRPSDDYSQKLEKMIESIERGLKKVSDVLAEKSDENDARLLCGVVRVGPLGEGIILNFDKTFNVVLLCKDVPTVPLIKQIVEDLPGHLDIAECDSENIRERFTFELLLDDSAFKVYDKAHDITCIVTLTSNVLDNFDGDDKHLNSSLSNNATDAHFNLSSISPKKVENESKEEEESMSVSQSIVKPDDVLTEESDLRAENESEEKEESMSVSQSIAKTGDVLPEEPCLRALTEIRHAKFFQAQCKEIVNLTEVVMLLRDIAKRVDTWSILTLYHIQVLTFKALSSHYGPLRISDGLRRVLEMLTCGTFLTSYSKLNDPCGKDETNLLSEISPQQRENLACSAQHAIRLIAFDQIYKILAVDKDDLENNHKRSAVDDKSEHVEHEKTAVDKDGLENNRKRTAVDDESEHGEPKKAALDEDVLENNRTAGDDEPEQVEPEKAAVDKDGLENNRKRTAVDDESEQVELKKAAVDEDVLENDRIAVDNELEHVEPKENC